MKRGAFDAIAPYQVLFPLGAAHAVVGASTWVLFALNLMPYPARIHAHHMFAGFLLSFVTGFLMTAVPSFTGTAKRSNLELALAAALSIASFFTESYLPAFLTLLFLGVFFLSRMMTKAATPPPHFIFIPIGLIIGIVGTSLATLYQFNIVGSNSYEIARVLIFYGMMLSFILGIGAKLIAAFLGWSEPPTHMSPANRRVRDATKPPWTLRRSTPFLQAVLFLAGLATELFYHQSLGRTMLAVCASWIAVQEWRLYLRPRAKGKLPFWTWVAAWLLLIGLWVHALMPELGVHAAHLMFIGGFGLITLLVASRVTLAHGSEGIALESTSRIYLVTAALVISATATRFVAQWTPSYVQHLGYAAVLWIFAILCWSAFFIPRMLFRREP